jgi:hypothetical protein
MTDQNATVSFFPAVRSGYRPTSTFSKSQTTVQNPGRTRAELELTATGPDGETTVNPGVDFTVYGPGEVTNLDADQIVRMEPEPDTTSFPPNYFPLVEFDSPQLPWLFSPQRADDAGRNRPWLCLVVVERGQVSFSHTGPGPLAVLETPTGELPDASQTWAWAHAQTVGEAGQIDPEARFAANSTDTISRLLCPRNLDGETKYRACVVPTFEPGRRAGLGLDPYPDGRSEISLAWTDEQSVRLPVYHTWEFSTSPAGDFEALVDELRPVELGDGVGYRTVDVSNPGPERLKLPADGDQGTVGIGGALKSIGTRPDPYDESMTDTLRELLNKPELAAARRGYDAVGPPLYGQHHAGVPYLERETMDTEEYYYPHWFNTLNTDPRHRIAAGYGTAVAQENQQRFVDSAWDQFGDLDGLNEYLNRMQLAEAVLSIRHERFDTYSTGSLLAMTAPVHGALEDDEGRGRTVSGTVGGTDLPGGMASTAFRRLTRPNGPLARQQGRRLDPEALALRLETGRVPRAGDLGLTSESVESAPETESDGPQRPDGPQPSAGESGPQAPPGPTEMQSLQQEPDSANTEPAASETPPDVARLLSAIESLETHVEAAARDVTALRQAVTQGETETVRTLVEQRPTVQDRCEAIGRNTFDPLSRAVAKLLAQPRPPGLPEGFDQQAANRHLRELHAARRQLESAIQGALEALGAGEPPKTVRQRLGRASGALTQLRQTARSLRAVAEGRPLPDQQFQQLEQTTAVTSDEAFSLATPSSPELAEPQPITLPDEGVLRSSVLEGLDPEVVLPDIAGEITGIGNLFERDDPVGEVLAAPSFDVPTAALLAELNQEYFLPGVDEVPRDSVGVLQTNPEFIESFMVGLNHEFARELQWQNFPTDKRGTYFRYFWERRGNPKHATETEQADVDSQEQRTDIEPLHTWDERDLGENMRHSDGSKVVLLVRGELLRRYPNTNIFAAKAVSERGGHETEIMEGMSGDRIPALPNTPITRSDAGEDVKFPEFRGRLDPDVTFFGFDLSPEEALYDPYHENDTEPDDWPNEGWFFVFQEPPGETRFGLDEPADGGGAGGGAGPPSFADLSWADVTDGDPDDVTYIDVTDSPPGRENWTVQGGDQRFATDDSATWGHNSAHMARLTWQLPVRVSIHADDMIPEQARPDSTRTASTPHTDGGDRRGSR